MDTTFAEMKRTLKHLSKSELILMLCKEIQLKSFYKNHIDLIMKELEDKAKESSNESKGA